MAWLFSSTVRVCCAKEKEFKTARRKGTCFKRRLCMTEYMSWREGGDRRRSSLTLLASEWQTCVLRKQGETPGRGVEEQQAHNEQWAGSSCLMGRFIISHYQLIPSDRPGPAAAHQKYVKERERESGGGREAAGWRERDVKRTKEVEGAGAVMWNVRGKKMRWQWEKSQGEWGNDFISSKMWERYSIRSVRGEEWENDKVGNEV